MDTTHIVSADTLADRAEGATPSMRQYFDAKSQHPDALMFFRMGDFYELFFEDAVAAASALDIALTKRGQHKGADIAMCGVPAHSAEGYLATLTRKGFKVAICEQMESPAEAKKRGSKSVVRRDIVRLVTPGTLTEDSLLDARRAAPLVALAQLRGSVALAAFDLSTGALSVMASTADGAMGDLAGLGPSEILVADTVADDLPRYRALEEIAPVTPLGPSSFDSRSAETRLRETFNVSSLDAYGAFSRVEIAALGAVLDYVAITQKGAQALLRPPVRREANASMRIDAATRRNLELTETMAGTRAGSLLATIDRTITGAGARLLGARIASPLTDPAAIARRADAVAFFNERADTAQALRDALKRVPDLARALSRLSLERGGPRDLAALREGLSAAREIANTLARLTDAPPEIDEARDALTGHDTLIDTYGRALAPDPPMLAREGGFIAAGYDLALDEVRALRDNSRRVIRNLETSLKAETGIGPLKVKFNNVLGYFVEVPPAHADKLTTAPHGETFIHRQTLASAVRFTTTELVDLDGKIARAGAKAIEAELALFEALRAQALADAEAISRTADALATLDVSSALAEIAAEMRWTRPKVDHSRAFRIDGGRHPVVEAALTKAGETFIPNACDLSDGAKAARLWLLTGPNMAGKSTFLRQNALIAVLAQAGSFVPASAAHIGIVDCLFSRVGASDDLARGRSTFMVEMVETAAILNQSGMGALVILDEIGRGTATFDGLSIAWATLEHLHDVNGCRGLFATHYHELTELAARLSHAQNAAMKVADWGEDVVFLHEVEPGAATKSYGVQVARKAGLPPRVVARARAVLDRLESGDAQTGGGAARMAAVLDDLPLFSTLPPDPEEAPPPSKIDARLRALDPDALTPRDALDLVYELTKMLE